MVLTLTAFIGWPLWDWDILLVELCMQASNFVVAACLHWRQALLRAASSPQRVKVLVTANSGLVSVIRPRETAVR